MLRRLLALLLSSANHPISTDVLADQLWAADPPQSARKTLQVYLHRLRRQLGDPTRITLDLAGYALRAGPQELDASVFADLVAEAVEARGRGELETAHSMLERARELWHGEAYAGFRDMGLVAAEADRLQEARLAAVEEHISIGLELGRHAAHVGELSLLVAGHPYRERLRGLLMLALYRGGRQAEALQAYRAGRDRLVADVGVEPMPELRLLHRQILSNDPELAGTATVGHTGPGPAWRLPNPLPDFVGRLEERDLIVRTVRSWRARQQSAVIAIHGLAGVGKTALALHAARELYPTFAGGQLFTDLRGHEQPRSTREILHTFLRELGLTGSELPDDVEQAAARYRQLLSLQPRLVVLDNAATVAQIQPLVAPIGSLTIVTSRSLLADLDGARFVSLSPLSAGESLRLLSLVLGVDAQANEAAAEEVVRLCGMLPLAVRLAAIRCLSDGFSLSELAAELRDSTDRLDGLSTEERSVRASILSGYRQLSTVHQRLLLGLASATVDSFPGWVAEPIAGAAGVRGLAESGLVERSGVDPTGGDRYRIHDLVRAFGQQELRQHMSDVDIVDMMDRYVAAWTAMAEHADADLVLNRAMYTVNRPEAEYVPPVGGYRTDPMTWFGTELPNLRRVLELCERYRLDRYYWRLCWNLEAYLRRVARTDDVIELARTGLAAAIRCGDERGVVCMRLSLAAGYLIIDDLDRAMSESTEALTVAERSGDAWLTAEILGVIVQVYAGRGELEAQLEPLRRAIGLYQEAGDEASAGTKLTALGDLYAKMDAPTQAADAFGRGIDLLRRAGAAVPLARGLRRLAQAHADAGRFEPAIPLLEECLQLVRQAGEPVGELCVGTELAICHCELGDPGRARPYAHSARQLAEQIDMPLYRSYAALGHSLYLAGTGREDLALRTLRDAVDGLAAMKLWQLTGLLHIGRWQLSQGEPAQGRATLHEGHSEAQRIGAIALARRFAAEQERDSHRLT